jgi:hypothetical protein
MVAYAIFTTADRKGSTRDSIWKVLTSTKMFQESIRDKKIFLTTLKRLTGDDQYFERSKDNMQRFKLNQKFKDKLKKQVQKGGDLMIAIKSNMTTKTENPKKPVSKMAKAKMSKTTKG